MNNSFDFKIEKNIDPGRVRNFLRDAQNQTLRKNYSMALHIVYSLVCAVIIYLATGSSFSFLPACIAPAMCAFTFLYSPFAIKLIPVVLPPLGFLVKLAISGFKEDILLVISSMFVYCLCILSGAILTKAVLSGYTKNTVLVLVSVSYGLICLGQIALAFTSIKGSFNISMLVEAIDEYFALVSKQSVELVSSEEGYTLFSMFTSATEQAPTKEEMIKLIKESVETTSLAIKSCLPAIFVLSCMIYGFITVAFFSVVARVFKIDVFVSIMDNFWTYRPSIITANVYDLLFIALVIGMFVKLPQNISATVINLLLILTPLMCLSGIKGIYTFFKKKTKNALAAGVITGAIILVASTFTGAFLPLILGSVGIFFITIRNREEKVLLPIKYAQDRILYQQILEQNQNADSNEN